jgi:hypothetical protein
MAICSAAYRRASSQPLRFLLRAIATATRIHCGGEFSSQKRAVSVAKGMRVALSRAPTSLALFISSAHSLLAKAEGPTAAKRVLS